MFRNKTVFILGAGASWHYGYPTGEQLVRQVIIRAKQLGNFCERSLTPPNVLLPNFVQEKISSHASTADRIAAWKASAVECYELANRLTQVDPLLIDYFLGQKPKWILTPLKTSCSGRARYKSLGGTGACKMGLEGIVSKRYFPYRSGRCQALLQRAQPFPEPPEELSGKHVDLTVPIRFSLPEHTAQQSAPGAPQPGSQPNSPESVGQRHGPSFDCKSTKNPNEKLICQSTELSELDNRMVVFFEAVMNSLNTGDRQQLRSDQREWLKDRLDCAHRMIATSCSD
jgi:hypothetical protein